MARTFRAQVEEGEIIPDELIHLSDGTNLEIRVVPSAEEIRNARQGMMKYVGTVKDPPPDVSTTAKQMWKEIAGKAQGLPPNASTRVDEILYGIRDNGRSDSSNTIRIQMNNTLEIPLKQIEFARQYTLALLADVDEADWFQMPTGCQTHIGWQVAHIAMAQYGLALFRQRGRAEVDLELMPSSFRKQFSRGSTPNPDPAGNPPPSQIRAVFDRVYAQVLKELPDLPPESLNDPVDLPYAGYPTKLGALLLASHHEMVHAGQIGLLRRLLGKPPLAEFPAAAANASSQ